ncbi:hypothetical protein Ancab_000756 [Ancistrocladus abbreviatus]
MLMFVIKLMLMFVPFLACILLPAPVRCDDEEEDNLLQGLNSYRKSIGLPALTKNKNAGCLADEIADKIEDHPCTPAAAANAVPGTGAQYPDYKKLLDKCNINPATTNDGVILPVCVPKLVPTLVLTNYTRSPYARHINDSSYTGAGIRSEDDWMVVVLTTDTPTGSLAWAVVAATVVYRAVTYFLVPMVLGLFLIC